MYESAEIKKYLSNVKHNPVSAQDEAKLLKKAHKGDFDARGALVEANQRFVIRMAFNFRNQGLPIIDLLQEGNLGLMEAIDRYDFKKKCRLISYAAWWIRLYMQRAIEQKSRTVTIPINKISSLKKIRNFEYGYVKINGKKPSYEEIGQAIDMDPEKVSKIYNMGTSTLSFHIEDEEGQTLENRLQADERDDVHRNLWLDELSHRIQGALSLLSPREKDVLSCRFGLEGHDDPVSLRQAGKRLGLSAEGVRQIQAHAIKKLRDPEFGAGLQVFA